MFDPVLFAALMGSTALFSPSSLFSAGEQGAWYDPSDFSTMFQDSAGTTPVTAVEQPVGKILDKSGRGNHATQATEASRPLLRQEATGQYYLAFDGTDDSLATGSIDFSATNKMSVWTGIRKLGTASSVGIMVELSAAAESNAGGFRVARDSSGYEYFIGSNGSAYQQVLIDNAAYSAPVTNVVTSLFNISEPSVTVRIDGTQVAQSTASQGTGNFGNYPLYIGSRGGSTIRFFGRLYSLIVRGAQSTDAQIASTESYVNTKTGAY